MSARWSLRSLIFLLVIAIQLAAVKEPASAAVTLVSFKAVGDLGEVLLEWETATELDNAGFYVRRGSTQSGTFTRVSPLIPSVGDPLAGAVYLWIDEDVVNGTTYWYQLEAINLNQNSEYFGPISATPGVTQPAVTGSATPTRTGTVTPDGQTASPTASSTAPPTITTTSAAAVPTRTPSTAYPAPVTSTPVIPAAPAATVTSLPGLPTLISTITSPTAPVSGTATLLPFPDLTLTFPESGIILPGSGTAAWTATPARLSADTSNWNPVGGVLLVVILVLIWGLLGTWFYLSFRRIS